MKEIISINNPYIKDLAKLNDKKYRMLRGEFLVEGYHLVLEAYKNGYVKEIYFINEDDIKDYKDVSLCKVSLEIIKKLSDTVNPQNIMALCEIKEFDIDYKNINHVLILDNVNDPGNVGTLIRSAKAFDIDLIVLSNNSVDIYNSKQIRSSQGAMFGKPIIYADLVDEINILKKNGFEVIGTSLDASCNLKDFKANNKYAIVLGNEANGMRDEIKALCDKNVIIEMNKDMESLNVSIAGSIVMYEFFKK